MDAAARTSPDSTKAVRTGPTHATGMRKKTSRSQTLANLATCASPRRHIGFERQRRSPWPGHKNKRPSSCPLFSTYL